MSRDVLAEFLPWSTRGSYAATLWLEAHGLPADVERLADALHGRPGPFGDVEYGSTELVLGAAPVRPVGDRLFEFADDGRWMALQPVEDAGGEVVDIIAPSKGAIAELLSYPFEIFNCRRITALVRVDNERARRLVEGLGFRVEGLVEDAYDDLSSAMLYGMTRRAWQASRWFRIYEERHPAQEAA